MYATTTTTKINFQSCNDSVERILARLSRAFL